MIIIYLTPLLGRPRQTSLRRTGETRRNKGGRILRPGETLLLEGFFFFFPSYSLLLKRGKIPNETPSSQDQRYLMEPPLKTKDG